MRILCVEENGENTCLEATYASYTDDVEEFDTDATEGLFISCEGDNFLVPGIDKLSCNVITERLLINGYYDLTRETTRPLVRSVEE